MENLVIVRAGDTSLHQNWLNPKPNFDLYVSYYGDNPRRFQEQAVKYEVKKGVKWQPLNELVNGDWEFISKYRYVAIVDDDLLATAREFNGVFRTGRRFNFDIFQPALTHNSYLNWLQTRREDDHRIIARRINMIEQMASFFKIQTLEKLKDTFGFYKTGWGLECHWQRRLSYPQYQCGIIDKFPFKHTRLCTTSNLYDIYRSQGINHMDELNHAVNETGQKCWEYKLYRTYFENEMELLI